MRTKWVLAAALLLSFHWTWADRGGWVSSGGEIFRFDRNPWFVKNVKTVSYCVQIDTATVSVSPDQVRADFKVALAYWKNEFGQQNLPATQGLIQLADQDFVEGPCSDTTDLRLKVGYGTLDADEIDFLAKPENSTGGAKKIESYIGVSLRKEYDFKQMRGKGTVFIASDLGPHAYKNDGQLVAQAWSQPHLLQYAFMHEMGHVFGIPHSGVGLMSEVFLDQALNLRMAGFYSQNPLQGFLSAPENFEICSFSGQFNPKFFQLTDANACLQLRSDRTPGSQLPHWKVFSKKYQTSDPVEIGSVGLESSIAKVNGAKPAVTVQVPDEQTVFSAGDRGYASFLLGGIFQEIDYQGSFRTPNSLKPYAVIANLRPDSVTFTAVVDGKMIPVLVYAPPTLLQMLIPISH